MITRRATLEGLAALPFACAGARAAAIPPELLATPCPPKGEWSLWKAYVRHFVQGDGRVFDPTGGGHSTSEGQAYAMVHALVADDRATFDRVLRWMDVHLAGGRLGANLPGWKWGKAEDGDWRLLDANAASDADVWAVWTLLEASRHWGAPRYAELARALAATVLNQEVVDIPGLGATLLPGPVGFVIAEDLWRLNPSYLPLQVLRGIAAHGVPGPWVALAESAARIQREASASGWIADWIGWTSLGPTSDPVGGASGSYDAIRCYLWSGMLHDDDPEKATLATRLDGMVRFWREHGVVPEKVNPALGLAIPRPGPVGFLACILPEIVSQGRAEEIGQLQAQIEATAAPSGLYGTPPTYYDTNLLLFGRAFAEGRLRFLADGRLDPAWKSRCAAP